MNIQYPAKVIDILFTVKQPKRDQRNDTYMRHNINKLVVCVLSTCHTRWTIVWCAFFAESFRPTHLK